MAKKTKKPLSPREKRLKDILKQVAGDVENMDGDLITPMLIRGSGIMYCYAPYGREFVKVCRGLRVYVVEEENIEGKTLIYTNEGYIVEIESEELEPAGFNQCYLHLENFGNSCLQLRQRGLYMQLQILNLPLLH